MLYRLVGISLVAVLSGCTAGRSQPTPQNKSAFVRISFLSTPTVYGGLVGAVPSTVAGFFTGEKPSVRVFLRTSSGAFLLSKPSADVGTLRRIADRKALISFDPIGVAIFRPVPAPERRLRMAWLWRRRNWIVLTGNGHCAVSADGKYAACIVSHVVASAMPQRLLVLKLPDGRAGTMESVLRPEKMNLPLNVTGVAFRGRRLLLTVGLRRTHLWEMKVSGGAGRPKLSVMKKIAASGRLVGVLQGRPVFESLRDRSLIIGETHLAFHGAAFSDVICGSRGILAITDSGTFVLWRKGRGHRMFNIVPSRILGAGAFRDFFWVAERDGTARLISAKNMSLTSVRLAMPAAADLTAKPINAR